MKVKLINNFHHRETFIVVPNAPYCWSEFLITKRQVQRAKNKLCGIKGCSCGGIFGERGVSKILVDYETSWGDFRCRLMPDLDPLV